MFEIHCPVVNYSLSSIRAVVGNLSDKVVPAILGGVLGILVSVQTARENVRITHTRTLFHESHDTTFTQLSGAICSSVVRVFAHGAMGRQIDPSW